MKRLSICIHHVHHLRSSQQGKLFAYTAPSSIQNVHLDRPPSTRSNSDGVRPTRFINDTNVLINWPVWFIIVFCAPLIALSVRSIRRTVYCSSVLRRRTQWKLVESSPSPSLHGHTQQDANADNIEKLEMARLQHGCSTRRLRQDRCRGLRGIQEERVAESSRWGRKTRRVRHRRHAATMFIAGAPRGRRGIMTRWILGNQRAVSTYNSSSSRALWTRMR